MILKNLDPIAGVKRLSSHMAITVCVLATLLLALPAHAQGPMMPPMGMPGMGMTPMGMPGAGMPPPGMPGMGMHMGWGRPPHAGMNPWAALNLTQEQLHAMRDTAKAAQATSLELMKRIGEEAGKLRSMFAEATPDAEKIGAAYQAIFDLQRQAIENMVTTYNQQVAVLDPEQLKKWNVMREQMMSRFFPAGATQQSK